MFHYAAKFESDLSNWDVSNVQSMEASLSFAHASKSDQSNWDMRSVTSMKSVVLI